ncbi:MAG: site-specific DNA-methyltransferase [Candidatus Binataceae bacterium]|nr:site-specific DNA-methyltransferase [Candidatus Binataceae bacterium]
MEYRVESDRDDGTVWKSEGGKSFLQLGDSLASMQNLPAGSVDCIWTDPPYLLSNDGITCVAGRMVKVNKGEWDRSRGIDLDHEFNRTWLGECFRILKPNGSIWVSGTLHVYLSVGMAMQQIGFRILNDIVWEKPAPPPNLGCRCFTHSTEILLWATKAKKGGKDRHKFNYELMKEENGDKQMKNVWRFSTPTDEEKRLGKHPTQKPVALIARCLRATTDPGDLVLDPFAGSGSTGVAALKLGRHFVGYEQNKTYALLAASRLSEIAGEDLPESISTTSALVSRKRQQSLFAKA